YSAWALLAWPSGTVRAMKWMAPTWLAPKVTPCRACRPNNSHSAGSKAMADQRAMATAAAMARMAIGPAWRMAVAEPKNTRISATTPTVQSRPATDVEMPSELQCKVPKV